MNVLDLCNMNSDLTEKINVIADNCKSEYTYFIDQLSIGKENNKYWWISPLVSRNTYLCDAFKDFCIVQLAVNEIKKGNYNEVVVSSKEIKECIIDVAKNQGVSVRVIKNRSKIISKFVWSLRDTLKRYFNIKKNLKDVHYTIENKVTLINTYLESSSFKDSKFKDRYFDGVNEYRKNSKLYFLTYIIDDSSMGYKEIIDRILNEKSYRFIICEYFLKLKDYLVLFKYWWECICFKRGKKVYKGIDYTPVINKAITHGMYENNAWNGIMYLKIIERMRKVYKLDIELLVDWYEGQSSSNGLFWGFRNQYPEAHNIGYVGISGLENQLGIYPSEMQYRNNASPEIYGVQGEYWKKLTRQFCQKVKCINVPSFRYSTVYDSKEIRISPNKDGIEILIILSYFVNWSKSLMKIVLETIDDMSEHKIKYYIKNHPNNSKFTLADYGLECNRDIDNMVFIDGSMDQALIGKDVVVLVGSSSGLEILVTGVPIVIYVPSGELIETGIPEYLRNEKCHIVYNSEQLKHTILKLNQGNRVEIMRERILNEAFVPVNEYTVNNMLKVRCVDE